MIAVSFFDALAGEGNPVAGRLQFRDIKEVAHTYVKSALADWDRVLECERQFACMSFVTPAEQSKVNRSLYEVYRKWTADAEDILGRAQRSDYSGEELELLGHAIGCAQARLKMTPEMYDRAREQIRQGQTIPMEELRDEFRARVRA